MKLLDARTLSQRLARRCRVLSAMLLACLTAAPVGAQQQQWAQQFGTPVLDTVRDGTRDGSGGLYVCGLTEGSLAAPFQGATDAWLARYDNSGSQPWASQFSFGPDASDEALAVAPDGVGGVFVAGISLNALGGIGVTDTFLLHYNSSGTQLWSRLFGSVKSDECYGTASDGAGGVYLVGATNGSLAGPLSGGSDSWIARYDSAGNQLWIRQFGSNSVDNALCAAADGSGGVYVAGDTWGNMAGANAGEADAWYARFDGAGTTLWVRQVGSIASDRGSVVVPDGSGGAFAGGDFFNDLWLTHVDGAGNPIWYQQFGTTEKDRLNCGAPDGAGGMFLGGSTRGPMGAPPTGSDDVWFARLDGAGTRLWTLQSGTAHYDTLEAIVPDELGGLLVGGYSYGDLFGPNLGVAGDAWVARYDYTCGVSTTFCTASATSIPGCQASISGSGSPSLAAPGGYEVRSGNVPGGTLGICFFGSSGIANSPLGILGGKICIQAPVTRSQVKTGGGTSGTCTGQFVFTLQDLIQVNPGILPGMAIHAEIWARDPQNADGYLLSNGLKFLVCP
jgi:hypothetical protein